jgi:hypothetical protein
MKKTIILLAVLALLPLSQAAAQNQNRFEVFSFDIGYAPSYVVSGGANATVNYTFFSLNVAVTDALTAGFTTIPTVTLGYALFNLKYQFLDQVRVVLSAGQETSGPLDVAGLGFEYAPFSRRYGNSFGTELKLKVDYVFPVNAVDTGTLFFGIAFGVGI